MNDNIKYGASDRRYSVPEACQRIGLATTAVYAQIRKGKLVARKLGRRTFIYESDIVAFLNDAPVLPASVTTANQNNKKSAGWAA